MTPDKYTIAELYLEVSGGHKLYVHDWGNKQSEKVFIYLHGGPGSGTSDSQKRKFNPEKMRVIFFDQRGSGRSLPYGKLDGNSIKYLAEDIESIRQKIGINKWTLVGSSWGSTLALFYAINYPGHVKGLVIDGVLIVSREEIDWLKKGQWQKFFPEIWQSFVSIVPQKFHDDALGYYLKKSLSADSLTSKKFVYSFMKAQAALVKLDETYTMPDLKEFDETPGLIEMHYLKNTFFMEPNYILKNADKIKVPVYVLQGRFDMVTPPMSAYNLVNKLERGHLYWTVNGHIKQHEANNMLGLILDKLA